MQEGAVRSRREGEGAGREGEGAGGWGREQGEEPPISVLAPVYQLRQDGEGMRENVGLQLYTDSFSKIV